MATWIPRPAVRPPVPSGMPPNQEAKKKANARKMGRTEGDEASE
jgi:hypothetical protein